jgi:hypothetical protein
MQALFELFRDDEPSSAAPKGAAPSSAQAKDLIAHCEGAYKLLHRQHTHSDLAVAIEAIGETLHLAKPKEVELATHIQKSRSISDILDCLIKDFEKVHLVFKNWDYVTDSEAKADTNLPIKTKALIDAGQKFEECCFSYVKYYAAIEAKIHQLESKLVSIPVLPCATLRQLSEATNTSEAVNQKKIEQRFKRFEDLSKKIACHKSRFEKVANLRKSCLDELATVIADRFNSSKEMQDETLLVPRSYTILTRLNELAISFGQNNSIRETKLSEKPKKVPAILTLNYLKTCFEEIGTTFRAWRKHEPVHMQKLPGNLQDKLSRIDTGIAKYLQLKRLYEENVESITRKINKYIALKMPPVLSAQEIEQASLATGDSTIDIRNRNLKKIDGVKHKKAQGEKYQTLLTDITKQMDRAKLQIGRMCDSFRQGGTFSTETAYVNGYSERFHIEPYKSHKFPTL